MATSPVAPVLVQVVERALGAALPIRLRAWDGSEAGPAGGPVVVVRDRLALRRLLWNPDELGLARAYVSGELDVEGDLGEALGRFWALTREGALRKLSTRDKLSLVSVGIRLGLVGLRPKPPAEEARLSGRKHSRDRDQAAIAHHYDMSNAFYERILDPNMAYSCGYWTSDAPEYTVEDAQRDKLELVCVKLGLRPGTRMLDVGCGWGSLAIHAAKHHGARVTAITLSREQREFVLARIAAEGLAEQVEVRLQDYRELADEPFDAIGTLEMGEHVGAENYPLYAATLFRMLKPQGRLLLQQMSRGAVEQGGGSFIETYIAPDMNMRPVGQTVDMLEQAGLEVRDVEAFREHYVWTCQAWGKTLESRWDELVALAGETTARVWRLYMAGSALAFAENRVGVHQVLAVRPTVAGSAGMPRTRSELLASESV
ncbi:cyclopropane-fatty-acyl-phospholipid synthase [Actinokineospora baliensis]|uniref:cyclopropane-fatty-acyl-phospholipid synthase family protein n=1 Tax=Actinokineospora baliensis TaxID=547056 RepID=UPI0027DAE322|nr:cyclopropane-fatty-acyl-phospholipid synthase family protein [Actinokineospora baliensis]MBM7775207.1 cyclopropane-fatty-acyl-phospholipid synthase [Actinokineospora baliensis]